MEHLDARTEREGDCLIWTGSTDSDGYGRLSVNGKWAKAHRLVWERANGPIPHGVMIDHTCWNRACVELAHLRLATNAENVRNGAGARPTNRSTGARNVYPKGKKFRVQIVKDGKSFRFGVHDTIEQAATIAAQKRRELFGEFAGRG